MPNTPISIKELSLVKEMSPEGQKKSLTSVGIDLTVHLVYLKCIYWVLRSIGSALLNFHAC